MKLFGLFVLICHTGRTSSSSDQGVSSFVNGAGKNEYIDVLFPSQKIAALLNIATITKVIYEHVEIARLECFQNLRFAEYRTHTGPCGKFSMSSGDSEKEQIARPNKTLVLSVHTDFSLNITFTSFNLSNSMIECFLQSLQVG